MRGRREVWRAVSWVMSWAVVAAGAFGGVASCARPEAAGEAPATFSLLVRPRAADSPLPWRIDVFNGGEHPTAVTLRDVHDTMHEILRRRGATVSEVEYQWGRAARDTIVIDMDLWGTQGLRMDAIMVCPHYARSVPAAQQVWIAGRGKQMKGGGPRDAAGLVRAVELFLGEMKAVGKCGW